MTAKAKSWSQVAILRKGELSFPQHLDPLPPPPPPLPYCRCTSDESYLAWNWRKAPSSRAAIVSAEAEVPTAWECSFRLP
jgi:hypothetical protein